MSVIGFDIGNVNCYIAVARAGGIETVDNEYSDRCTPAVVSFNSRQRMMGVSAKNQMTMNFKSTITQFKRLIGRKYDEPAVQKELQLHPNKFVRMEDGGIGIEVQYKDQPRIFSPEQIMAMFFTQLKTTASDALQTKVTDCVISVPSYFTDYQRRSLLLAAEVAGLNCLKLMNDTSAVALNYGLFKQDLPAPEEKPRHVAFVDCGHSSFQVCIAAFNKGKIKILSTASDASLGGRDFDEKLKNYFAEAFLQKYKIDPKSNAKAWLRLSVPVEKMKKQLSANSTDLPLNIECYMNDIDVTHKVNREQFEEMCKDLFERIEAPLIEGINGSGLKVEDVDCVEVVGGSTRIPAIKAVIERVFGKPVSTTLNLDEAVSRGCAIQCAMLSHTVRVRDIEVSDAATYPIHISWDSTKADEVGEMEVFKKYHSYPFTKMLTFPHRVEPFRFKAYYHNDVDVPQFDKNIGEFVVNATASEDSCEKVKVKVKVRLDMHGCFTVSSATQVETLPPAPEPEPPKEEAMEASSETVENGEVKSTEENKTKEMNTDPPADQPEKQVPKTEEKTEGKEKKEEKKEEKKPKPKKLTKNTDLAITKEQANISPLDLNKLIEIENELISDFRLEKLRSDAKNAVEEYVYATRDGLYGIYENYVTENDRAQLSSLLEEVEDWLYGDGEDLKKQAYVDKLAELKKHGDPIAARYQAHSHLPAAFESFGKSFTHFRKILDLYANKDEKYAHIEESEMKKVQKKVEEKFKWFNEKMQENAKCPQHSNPAVYPAQILSEKKILDDFCNPIVNKAKPKAEPPKDKKEKEATASKDESAQSNENAETKPETANAEAGTEKDNTQEKMETEESKTRGSKENLDMEVD
ncbi:heat shock protein 105 kDa-like [Hydractinia symbiolongicarpus]|uniref:heat shock protein 105 kDa-like n=1 Tax=Hydractinia symbiolongicarpus TaxID=13093 RepID=UPI00254BDCF2|nr:heat shock protein 105 kDa-like [Hydractinia symbiolongicarpus]